MSDTGLELTFDVRLWLIHVHVPPKYKDKTCGLCGKFNGNQKDDFTTAENVIEESSDNFGNSWKSNPNCPDVVKKPHPCELQKQRASFADTHCNKLNEDPFTKCHHVVMPEDYIAACKFDACSMENSLKVTCDAISAYTKACADQGIVVDWKNTGVIGECGKSLSIFCI